MIHNRLNILKEHWTRCKEHAEIGGYGAEKEKHLYFAVVVSSTEGRSLPLRALIDTGADRTFISESDSSSKIKTQKSTHTRDWSRRKV